MYRFRIQIAMKRKLAHAIASKYTYTHTHRLKIVLLFVYSAMKTQLPKHCENSKYVTAALAVWQRWHENIEISHRMKQLVKKNTYTNTRTHRFFITNTVTIYLLSFCSRSRQWGSMCALFFCIFSSSWLYCCCLASSDFLSISYTLSQFTFTHQTQKKSFSSPLLFFWSGKIRNDSYFCLFLRLFCWFFCCFYFSLWSILFLFLALRFNCVIFIFRFDKSAVFEKRELFFFSFKSVVRVKLCEFLINRRVIYFSSFFFFWNKKRWNIERGIVIDNNKWNDNCVLFYIYE